MTAGITGMTASSSAQAATDATPGYSLHHITVNTKVGPNGDQACTVDADLYIPDGASRSNRKPSILTTNGFGGRKDDSNESAIGRGFVKQGYVVLAYTGLGFGNSDCKITLDDPDYDGKAGSQMVGVLAGSHTYIENGTTKTLRVVSQEKPGDPRVGMIGGSYGGQIQYAVAMQDKRVDALIPIITWNDLSYSLAPNNTSIHGVTYKTQGVAKKEWVDLFFGDGIIDGVQDGSVNPVVDLPPCPHFTTQACNGAVELNSQGYPGDGTLALARHASVSTYMKKIKIPTLLAQGQHDTLFNLQEAVATYKALRAQGTPVRMVWQSWGHSDSTPAPGELDLAANSLRDSYLGNRFLDWMNHYVRGRSNAPVGPRFAYFRDWVKYDTSAAHAGTAVRKAYVEADSFSEAPTASLYLSSDNSLVKYKSNLTGGSVQYVSSVAPASYSETSGVEGSEVNNDPSDTPGTVASFTSRPLAHAVNLVGSSSLTLHIDAPTAAQSQGASPNGKLVFFAKIYDVAPNGDLKLQGRLISPVRVTDVTKPVDVQLPAVVQHFAAGHKIQLTIASSDFAYGPNAAPHPVTITSSKSSPSVLRMPLHQALTFN